MWRGEGWAGGCRPPPGHCTPSAPRAGCCCVGELCWTLAGRCLTLAWGNGHLPPNPVSGDAQEWGSDPGLHPPRSRSGWGGCCISPHTMARTSAWGCPSHSCFAWDWPWHFFYPSQVLMLCFSRNPVYSHGPLPTGYFLPFAAVLFFLTAFSWQGRILTDPSLPAQGLSPLPEHF